MNKKSLEEMLTCLELIKYAYLCVDHIGRGPRRISIVENNNKFDVYTSNERGSVLKKGENLSEKEACELVVRLFETAKRVYEKYEKEGSLEESGYYTSSKK